MSGQILTPCHRLDVPATSLIRSDAYSEVPTLAKWEIEPKSRTLPSGIVLFSRISFEISNNSASEAFSLLVKLIQFFPASNSEGTKF
jgi:hypothetical protein